MNLWHVTTLQAIEDDIAERGVDPMMSQSDKFRSWFVIENLIHWAICHVMKRHGVPIEEVRIVECDIPRSKLRRFQRGIWFTEELTVPERFNMVWSYIGPDEVSVNCDDSDWLSSDNLNTFRALQHK